MQRSFVGEMLAAWNDLRGSIRRQMDLHPREATITAYIMFGCFGIFLGFLPRLFATDLSNSPDQSLAAGVVIWLFVVMFFAPLFFYGLSALTHLVAKQFGGKGTYYTARLSMGWMLVVTVPLILIKTLFGSIVLNSGIGGLQLLNLLLISAMVYVYAVFIHETEGFRSLLLTNLAIFGAIAALIILQLIFLPPVA